MSQETKECPFCAETIKAQARKCRFCGEFLDDWTRGSVTSEPTGGVVITDDADVDNLSISGAVAGRDLIHVHGDYVQGKDDEDEKYRKQKEEQCRMAMNWDGKTRLRHFNLAGCDLSEVELSGADLRNCFMNETDLRGTRLKGSDLRSAYLHRANLHGAVLIGADLRGATLTSATLMKADLSGAQLGGAKLAEADLMGADLSEARFFDTANAPLFFALGAVQADLYRADLTNAKLTFANLQRANLRGAILIGANLMEADLRGADLNNLDLSGAFLAETRLAGAVYGNFTKWPDGFDPEKHGAIRKDLP